MLNCKLLTAQSVIRRGGTEIPLHQHRHYEIVYYKTACGSTVVENKSCRFFKNSYYIIFPGVEHSEQHEKDGRVLFLEFDTDLRLESKLYRDKNYTAGTLLHEILNEVCSQPPGYKSMLQAKLTELLIGVYRQNTTAPKEQLPQDFSYAITYLQENFHEKIQLADLAEQLHYSYDYFQHRFKTITGLSPSQFLLQQRLAAAKELLKTTHKTCTEIALSCGFCTAAQFSMQFKKCNGVSPTKYKLI